jgi:hypothetical protein
MSFATILDDLRHLAGGMRFARFDEDRSEDFCPEKDTLQVTRVVEA